MSSATSPALPPFSYAQAARGLTPSNQTTSKSPEPNVVPAEQNAKEAKPVSEPGKLELTSNPETSGIDKTRKASTGSEAAIDQPPAIPENVASNKETIHLPSVSGTSIEDMKPATPASTSSPPPTDASSQPPKSESSSLPHNEGSESWDKQSEISTYAEKSTQVVDKGKNKDSEDDWEKVSASAIPIEKELKPAPIPAVNFWSQRKEQNAAKAKEPVVPQRPSATPPGVGAVKVKSDVKAIDKNQTVTEKDSTGTRKKPETSRPSEGARRDQGQTNVSRPGSQQKEKTVPLVPPPVGDAESWPTPDTAIEERRKSATFEKSDKGENKSTGSKTQKWTHVPYVPSVVFETQLPPAAARRGGRTGNRGREGTGRNGLNTSNNAVADKNDSTNAMPPPPVPERGRRADGNRGGRAASVPTQGKRTPSVTGDSRKISETPGRDRGGVSQTKQSIEDSVASAKSALAGAGEPPTVSAQDAQPLSRTPTNTATGPGNNTVPPRNAGEGGADIHAHPASESESKSPADWYKGASLPKDRNSNGLGRENSLLKRHSQGDRAGDSRAKVESWRDRESPAEQTGRRESRPERGRGSYRGRGLHSTYNTQTPTNQPFTSPLPQQGFAGPKPNSFHRQSSHSQTGSPSNPTIRGNPRSQSITANNMYQPFPNGMVNMGQPLSPIQTDIPMYGYVPMHPGAMSAMPYNGPLESYALISMVQAQVEYYFSIDNLCKDMFLRRNMDSQGWVPISVIANFKRIRALTEDFHLLRMVCSRLNGVEYLEGQNGEEDRLRSREKWSEFVLDTKDRLPEAQNEGPAQQAQTPTQSMSNGYPRFSDPYYSAPGQVRSPTWNPASMSGAGASMMSPSSQPMLPQLESAISETPVSAHVPDFGLDGATPSNVMNLARSHDHQKSQSINGLNGFGGTALTNGHHTQENTFSEGEDVFPNEKIANLGVWVRPLDNIAAPSQQPFMSISSRTFSHGSVDESTDLRSSEMSTSSMSGLRGGAGSPEKLERLQMPRQPVSMKPSYVEPPPVLWIKDINDRKSPMVLNQEGPQLEPYLLLYDRALSERRDGDPRDQSMDQLYAFWSHFLVRNFNVSMYEEFHHLALTDLEDGSDLGGKHLVRYYEALLTSQTPLSDRLAQHIVDMAQNEPGGHRLAFQKLRASWRNGAFNMRSRGKINKILPASLRAELEH